MLNAEFRYTVICEFTNATNECIERWLEWMKEEHLADVIAAGAQAAEVVALDGAPPTYEVRYQFLSREAFDAYEHNHAPRLRADGLKRFPLSDGLTYRRTTGLVIIRAGTPG